MNQKLYEKPKLVRNFEAKEVISSVNHPKRTNQGNDIYFLNWFGRPHHMITQKARKVANQSKTHKRHHKPKQKKESNANQRNFCNSATFQKVGLSVHYGERRLSNSIYQPIEAKQILKNRLNWDQIKLNRTSQPSSTTKHMFLTYQTTQNNGK